MQSDKEPTPSPAELDAALATRLMGLVEGQDFGNLGEHDCGEWSKDGRHSWGDKCWKCGVGCTYARMRNFLCHKPPPAYSTDRALLGDVLARLAEVAPSLVVVFTSSKKLDGTRLFPEPWTCRVEMIALAKSSQTIATADTPSRALALAVVAALKEGSNA